MPNWDVGLSLPDVFRELREGGAGLQRKLLIAIGQFEQWLHAHPELENTQLVHALRQCEGENLQVDLLVRDDFYLAVNRIFQALEIPLLERKNYAVVDLFSREHAEGSELFGRAFGMLGTELSPANEDFLAQAVEGLAEDGRVISVRVALRGLICRHDEESPLDP